VRGLTLPQFRSQEPHGGSQHRAPLLTSSERQAFELVTQQQSATNAERSRAQALLLMDDHVDSDVINNRTGIGPAAQRSLLRSYQLHGFSSALARSSKKNHWSKYPTALVLECLRDTLKSRPPEGSTRWDLRKLAKAVRTGVSGAEHISAETIRLLLRRELGIQSVRQIEPFWLAQVRRHQRRQVSAE
jgi:hypothetical protein